MSKKKGKKTNETSSKKKKVVVSQKKKVAPTVSRSRKGANRETAKAPLLFGKQNYMFMGIGVGLILLGMLLMTGGGMENPNEWKPEVIYGWRRTILAPFVILLGLGMQIYAIFKKNETTTTEQV